MSKPYIHIGGSSSKGTAGIASTGNVGVTGTTVVIDGHEVAFSFHQRFDNWLSSQKNTNVPAIEDGDYKAVAERWQLNNDTLIRAVFTVESGQQSFNPDGSSKALLERHLVRRNLKAKYPAEYGVIAKTLGPELCAITAGGYKGGIAEWQRVKDVACGIASITGDFDGALNLALSSASHGGPQILGKWAEPMLGYSSPRQMVEAFHRNEDRHLAAFVAFIESNGLDKHLRNAAASMSAGNDPYPHIEKFAKGYNGPRCCDRGAKRKNYAAEILRAWRSISGKADEFKPLQKSRTVQGAVVSTGANIGLLTAALEALGITDITNISLPELINTVNQAKDLTEKATELAAQNADLINSLQNYKALFWYMVGLMVLSQLGNIRALWARLSDRLRGYK